MKAGRNRAGVFQIFIEAGDDANAVATHVANNKTPGLTRTIALLTQLARMNNDLASELKVDFDAFVADGSQMFYVASANNITPIRSGDAYCAVIGGLL